MAVKLLAARFENNDAGADILESFGVVESAGVRWDIEQFGVDTIEVTVKTSSKYDQYARMNEHLGQRLALYSQWGYRPISGNIVGVQPAGARRVQYTCKGAGWRHGDELVRAIFPTGEDTDDRIKSLLTNYVGVVSSDQSEIDATGTDASEFQTQWPRGNYPSEIINEYRAMSDSSNNPWYYWCIDEPFSGTSLNQFKAYFKNINSYTAVNWQVDRKDLSSLKLNRSIAELTSDARVFYGTIPGTVTTGSGGVTLTDTSATFVTDEIQPGDTIVNITDGSRGRVDAVNSETVLVLVGKGVTGGTADNFTIGDEYAIERKDAWESNTATVTTAPLIRQWSDSNSRYTSTQAQNAANERVTFYGKEKQQTNFVISSPFIRNGAGAKLPLWEVIAQGGGIIRIGDLYPNVQASGELLDSLTTFFLTSMDYDHPSNSLTCYVDSRDGRLDARLRRAGIDLPGMVARR